MSDMVVFTVRCAHCTGPIRLYVSGCRQELHHRIGDPAGRLAVWTCPTCHETNQGRFPGRLELVDDGVDEEDQV